MARKIGANPADPNGLAKIDVPELLVLVDEWRAVAIAGQLTYDSGILKHYREFPVALVHANDVCGPDHLESPNRWSWIKMVQPAANSGGAALGLPGP